MSLAIQNYNDGISFKSFKKERLPGPYSLLYTSFLIPD